MRAATVAAILVLGAGLISWERGGEGFHIVQTLPFCGGPRRGLVEVAGIILLLMIIWGFRRLRRPDRGDEGQDQQDQTPPGAEPRWRRRQ